LILAAFLALIAGGGYTAYAGGSVYRSLDGGRQELVAAQATIKNASQSADVSQLQIASDELKQAERTLTPGPGMIQPSASPARCRPRAARSMPARTWPRSAPT
jgi:hypothetical protein